jgi:protein TonB
MSYEKTDRYIEKAFLYLLALSLMHHTAMFMVIIFLPQEEKVAREQPVMIDLQDLPTSKEDPAREKKDVKRFAEEKRRVAREKAPKGEMERERIASMPQRAAPPAAQPEQNVGQMAPAQAEKERMPPREAQYGENLLKPREERAANLARLFSSPGYMARLDLKSSGSDILDNEVLRTLHQIGPIGSLPKGYTKDKFYLIASFHYDISNGMNRTLN